MAKRISYEIIPGAIFPRPAKMITASFAVKAAAQKTAELLFHAEIMRRLGLQGAGSPVVIGGWKGDISPSSQIIFSSDVDDHLLKAYAAILGLIWKQDAVAISHLHPDGSHLAILLRKASGGRFSAGESQRLYETLYRHDAKKEATIGFFEADGSLVFINAGQLSDDEFHETIYEIAATQLAGEVDLYLARADFELEWTDWSSDHGERYRQRIREAGRSDLLNWIETDANRKAEAFIEEFDWGGRKGRSKRRKKGK